MSEIELVTRLERLERDNRRLKRIALAALVLVAAMVALGAAYAKPEVPQKIVAHEFDVVDAAGATVATMSTYKGWPHFVLNGPLGSMTLGTNGGPGITLYSREGVLMLLGGGKMRTVQAGPQISFISRHGAGVDIGVEENTASITLRDAQGFGMDLGSTSTVVPVTGQTQQTSADSIVMFGNDKKHHVIWQAPQ